MWCSSVLIVVCGVVYGVVQIALDPLPRVLLIEHIGMITIGSTHKDCVIAADIYEHTVETIKSMWGEG